MARPKVKKPLQVERNRCSSRKLVLTAVIGGAVLAGIVFFPQQSTPSSHNAEVAQHKLIQQRKKPSEVIDHTQRQAYLDNLLQGIELPYCSGVIYDNDGSKIVDYIESELSIRLSRINDSTFKDISREEALAQEMPLHERLYNGGWYGAKVPEVVELSDEEKNSPIFVGRRYFEDDSFDHLTANDLSHLIAVHENKHVLQHAFGLPFASSDEIINGFAQEILRKDVFYSLSELDALYHELRGISQHQNLFSPEYFSSTQEKYIDHYLLLQNALPSASGLEKKMINKAFDSFRAIKVAENNK